MTPAEFSENYEDTLMTLEEALEGVDEGVDYETVNGILTITFENNSVVIITPQNTTGQLWVAAKTGGFHFNYEEGTWFRTTDNKSLNEVMSELFEFQGGLKFTF